MSVTLPLLRLEIAHQKGVDVFDPNGLILKVAEAPDLEREWEPIGSADAHVPSILSDRPAIIYRSGTSRSR